eukprot:7030000-Prymnesium_polylepis.1
MAGQRRLYSRQKCPPGGLMKNRNSALFPRPKFGWPRLWPRGVYVVTQVWDAEKGWRCIKLAPIGPKVRNFRPIHGIPVINS